MRTQIKPVANSRGVVALITSIIVSLLLVVITGSGVAIMRAELRQASDFDLSTKAYFAAESGLEDAFDKIREELSAGNPVPVSDTCDTYAGYNPNLSGDNTVAYTCQLVTENQTQLLGELNEEQSAQIDLAGTPESFNRIKISWNQDGTSDPDGWESQPAIPAQFPPGPDWSGVYPAVMEISFISYPTGSFAAGQINEQTIVLKPSSSGAQNNSYNIQTEPEKPEIVRCTPTNTDGQYECGFEFLMPSSANRNYVIRLHARYGSTHYKVEAFNGGCGEACKVDIPGTQIIVDVTGKAGDVFRRIQAKGFLSQASPLPFAILTDESICKVLEFTSATGTVTSGAETGCAP